jgi:hypothetical protein
MKFWILGILFVLTSCSVHSRGMKACRKVNDRVAECKIVQMTPKLREYIENKCSVALETTENEKELQDLLNEWDDLGNVHCKTLSRLVFQ